MTGLTVRLSDGTVMVDMTMNLPQTLGYVDTNSAAGSITLPVPPAGKTLFYIPVPLVNTSMARGKLPGITISGQTMSWGYSYNQLYWGNFSANTRIYYGYY